MGMNTGFGVRRCLLIAVAVLQPASARGQERQDGAPLPRLPPSHRFDGQVDPGEWGVIAPLALTTFQPVYGATPSERTEIRIAHDGSHLHLAARMYDGSPSAVRVNSLYRDRLLGDDVVGLVLDSFDDQQNGLWFQVNAAGVRVDQAIANDAEGPGAFNAEWNGYWDARAWQDSLGWSVELRIPFSSLGFEETDGDVAMGLIVYRHIARINEIQVYPAIRPDWPRGYLKPSQAQRIVLRRIEASTPLYFTPYVLGGVSETTVPPTPDVLEFTRDRSLRYEGGLDVKYNVTSNHTLDLTFNTDFAQVEVDDQQINLTRFSLFFPEKRQFFQERSGVFGFLLGPGPFADRIFHSRQIGLTTGGEPVRTLGGARLVGRQGGWDIGALTVQTGSHDDLPAENFGTVRLRRDIINPGSYVGGILTSRLGAERNNVVAGVDGQVHVGGNDYLIGKWAQTLVDPVLSADSGRLGRAGLGLLRFERRTSVGLYFDGQVTWSGSQFRPALGFITRRNYAQLQGRLAHGWLRTSGSLRTVSVGAFGVAFRRNAGGEVESALTAGSLSLGWRSGLNANIQTPGFQLEDLPAPLQLPGGVTIPAGRYTYLSRAGIQLATPAGFKTRSSFFVAAGGFFDGWAVTLQATPSMNLSRHLVLSGDYRLDAAWFDARDDRFTTHLVRARGQLAFDAKASLDGSVQYNSAARVLLPSLRFRYNLREGSDLWIVVNQVFDLTADLPEQGSAFRARNALVKLTYSFGG